MSERILAVEDTPSLRTLLQLCLTRAGYRVDLAEDGLAATEMFLAGKYDAVVMDIQMPVMDGLTAVARMRASEKERERAAVPILALTANTEPSELRKCLEAGFTSTIRKPFSREGLINAVSREFGTKSSPPESNPIIIKADPEFAELIPPFLESCRRETASMLKSLDAGDHKAIAAICHKLTGAGASFGFQTLSDEARLIEAAAKKSDSAGARTHIQAIALYLERVSVVYP